VGYRSRRLWKGARVAAALALLGGLPGEAGAEDAGSETFAIPAAAGALDAGPADDVDEAAAIARESFKRGTALARDGHWKDALAAFEHSAELRSHAVTTYNVAYCERALGRYVRARKLFARALSDHQARGGVELPEDLIASADDYLAEADRKLARVTVKLAPEDAAVSVDGAPLETLPPEGGRLLFVAGTRRSGPPEVVGAAAFEVLLDPGPHKFLVAHAGYRDGVLERTLSAGERGDIQLGAGKLPPSSAEAKASAKVPHRLPAYAAFGVGAVGLAVGVTAGIVALGKRSQLDDLCKDKQCYDEADGNATLQAARTAANISTIGLLVGAGGAATGAVLWWLTSPEKNVPRGSESSAGFSARVGIGSITVVERF
jgi:tetratricopeptide (TPR) repeat protein